MGRTNSSDNYALNRRQAVMRSQEAERQNGAEENKMKIPQLYASTYTEEEAAEFTSRQKGYKENNAVRGGSGAQNEKPGEDLLANTKAVPQTMVVENEKDKSIVQNISEIFNPRLAEDWMEKRGSVGKGQIASQYDDFKKDLKSLLETYMRKTSPEPQDNPAVIVNDTSLESISRMAVKADRKWLGKYEGVNTQDIVFNVSGSGANLKGMDNVKRKGEGKDYIKSKIAQFAKDHLIALYPEISEEDRDFNYAISDVFNELGGEDKLKGIDQIVAADTLAYTETALNRNRLSSADAFISMLRGYNLSPTELDGVSQVLETLEGKATTEDDKHFYQESDIIVKTDLKREAKEKRKNYPYEGPAQSDNRAADPEFTIFLEHIKNIPAGGQTEPGDISRNFGSLAGTMRSEAVKEFIPGIQNRDIMLRYKLFQTMLHEFFHYITHPNFENVITENPAESVFAEGLTDLFGLDVWMGLRDKLLSAGEDDLEIMEIRGAVEGWSEMKKKNPGFKVPKLQSAWLPNYYVYGEIHAAQALKNKIGYDNLKAAYFLGHTEFIGYDKYKNSSAFSKSPKEIESTDKGAEPYLMPGGAEYMGFYTGTLYQIAFERGMYTELEGKERDLAWSEMQGQILKDTKSRENDLTTKNKDKTTDKEWQDLQDRSKMVAAETTVSSVSLKWDSLNDKATLNELEKLKADLKSFGEEKNLSEKIAGLQKEVDSKNEEIRNEKNSSEKIKKQTELEQKQEEITVARINLTKLQDTQTRLQSLRDERQKAWDDLKLAEQGYDQLRTANSTGLPDIKGEINYMHTDNRTLVFRSAGEVIALEDTQLSSLLATGQFKKSKDSELWKTWFIKQEKVKKQQKPNSIMEAYGKSKLFNLPGKS